MDVTVAATFVRLTLGPNSEVLFQGRATTLDALDESLAKVAEATLVLIAVTDPDHPSLGRVLGIINQHGLSVKSTRLADFSDLIDEHGRLL